MLKRKWIAAAAVAATIALGALACSDPVAPAAPTPVTPTTTESFTGTVIVTGVNTFPFTVSAVGGVEVTLTDVEPAAELGLAIGTLNNGACSVVQRTTTGQLTGTATIAGSFCLQVYDPGTLKEPVTFTVKVLHS